jgi:hypothetical protein
MFLLVSACIGGKFVLQDLTVYNEASSQLLVVGVNPGIFAGQML